MYTTLPTLLHLAADIRDVTTNLPRLSNRLQTGKTALYWAMGGGGQNGHKEIAKLLIEAGADCSVCDLHARSILDEAWKQKWQKGKTDEDKELYDLIEEKGGTVSRISSGALGPTRAAAPAGARGPWVRCRAGRELLN